jgi:hypothetical protein
MFAFLSVLVVILSIGHFVVYESLIIVFNLVESDQVFFLKTLFIFLDVSFVVASVVSNRWNNVCTRLFYTISAVWMGFFNYLFLVSVFYGVIVYFIAPPFLFGVSLYLFALCLTI